MGLFTKKALTKESYISFITSYKSIMYKIAYGYLSSDADSMEAVDETVYLGFAKIRQLKEPEALKSWITRILINECYRILRSRKKLIISHDLPETPSEEYETSMTVKTAVENLPEELKEIIILRYFADYSVK
ncbi:MAG TPA: sigma-70 family RNA polymerase sigma factor, partial [Proteiniclasticum sp.]|nr:sigma-70 family RNA polymerase sigma factor [Proteiniclasticum sp.]